MLLLLILYNIKRAILAILRTYMSFFGALAVLAVLLPRFVEEAARSS